VFVLVDNDNNTAYHCDAVCMQGGVIAVGGNSKFEVPLNLETLAKRSQSVLGVHRGSRRQLLELVKHVADGQVGGITLVTSTRISIFICNSPGVTNKRTKDGALDRVHN